MSQRSGPPRRAVGGNSSRGRSKQPPRSRVINHGTTQDFPIDQDLSVDQDLSADQDLSIEVASMQHSLEPSDHQQAYDSMGLDTGYTSESQGDLGFVGIQHPYISVRTEVPIHRILPRSQNVGIPHPHSSGPARLPAGRNIPRPQSSPRSPPIFHQSSSYTPARWLSPDDETLFPLNDISTTTSSNFPATSTSFAPVGQQAVTTTGSSNVSTDLLDVLYFDDAADVDFGNLDLFPEITSAEGAQAPDAMDTSFSANDYHPRVASTNPFTMPEYHTPSYLFSGSSASDLTPDDREALNYSLDDPIGASKANDPLYHDTLYSAATQPANRPCNYLLNGQHSCQHKSEELKCNHDQLVGSDLSSYSYKFGQCNEICCSSSTELLVDHEPENLGSQAFVERFWACEYKGCERAVPSNGFSSLWELDEHRKGAHNDLEAAMRSWIIPMFPLDAPGSSGWEKRKHYLKEIIALGGNVVGSPDVRPHHASSSSPKHVDSSETIIEGIEHATGKLVELDASAMEVAGPSEEESSQSTPKSKSRPSDTASTTTQTLVNPEHGTVQDGWEVMSVVSAETFHDSAKGTSLSSAFSESKTKTAREEILRIFVGNQEFHALLVDAASKLDKDRFVRNIRRLLLLYKTDLSVQLADDPRETDAVAIVYRHAHWLACRAFDLCRPEASVNAADWSCHLGSQDVDNLQKVEDYLGALRRGHGPSQFSMAMSKTIDEDYQQDLSMEDDDIDYSRFPNLEHMKVFLIGGTAFANLVRSTAIFLNPGVIVEQQSLVEKDSGILAGISTSKLQMRTSEEDLHDLRTDCIADSPSSFSGHTSVTTPASEDGTESESSLGSDTEFENEELRITDPSSYMANLKQIEQQVFSNTLLFQEQRHLSTSFEDDDRFLTGQSQAFDLSGALAMVRHSRSGALLRLVESSSMISSICRSLSMLQNARFCDKHISLMVIDRERSSVVRMCLIEVDMIREFEGIISEILSRTLLDLRKMVFSAINTEVTDHYLSLSSTHLRSKCFDLLSRVGFSGDVFADDSVYDIVHYTTQILQLGLLSYAGAHTSRFDLEFLGHEINHFEIPRDFVYFDRTLNLLSADHRPRRFVLRRRQLQCMDEFLANARPWVFHPNNDDADDGRLFLATTITALTDIWGPAWRIGADGDGSAIRRLDIGNGAVLPWSPPGSSGLLLREEEVLCHWVAFKNWDDSEVLQAQATILVKTFKESDTLMIGAAKECGLLTNEQCIMSTPRLLSLKSNFDQQGLLRNPKTFRSERYLDSQAIQVQGSALGFVSAAGMLTYKRRTGQVMKDALMERWRHGERNPVDLEMYGGVEISLCTRNARRRRLLQILASSTIVNYLSSSSFQWISAQLGLEYVASLRSPKQFRRFWKGLVPEDRRNVGDAVTRCLDVLEETGVHETSRELRGFWSAPFDEEGDSDGESDDGSNREVCEKTHDKATDFASASVNCCEDWVVTLFKSEHTWTEFLKDSEESMAVAIVSTTCLDFDHDGYGRRCSRPKAAIYGKKAQGYPVLQTSLHVNMALLDEASSSKSSSKIGLYSRFEAGTKFNLGDHGSLKVLTGAHRACPMVTEWRDNKSDTSKEIANVLVNEKLLCRPKELHHREYIRGKWAEKPVPVLVLSKSNKLSR